VSVESSGGNAQCHRIIHQPVHHSFYYLPQQQAQQQSLVRPAAALTHLHQANTPGVHPKNFQINQENVSKNRSVTKMGRVHYTRADAILEGEPIMMGMFSIAKQNAVILFDSSAPHTFINRAFVMQYYLPIEVVDNSLCIQSLGG